jgi:hypothetical protein
MKAKLVLASALLAACAPAIAAPAASGHGSWDFRFGLGFEPKVSEGKYDFDDNTPDFTQDWDAPGSSLEFNVSHRFRSRSAHGAFVTVGAFLRGFDGDDDFSNNLRLGVIGIQGGGGYSFQPSEFYTLEIGPHLGIGFAGARERVPGVEDLESSDGGYVRLDLGVTNTFNFGRFQLGATLGVASWAAAVRYDAQTLNSNSGPVFFPGGDVTYSGSGAFGGITLGFR